MSVYVGINSGTKKKISSLYICKSGVKNVSKGYALNGSKVQQVFSKKGQQIFTSSGTFTVPAGVTSVDVFLVGGGGKGGGLNIYKCWEYNWCNEYSGSGGGGGYTKTVKGVSVTPGKSYSIVVGAGSIKDEYGSIYTGGSSTALGYSADGGQNGIYAGSVYSNSDIIGGNGGSGGGVGSRVGTNSGMASWVWAGNGGSDGSYGYANAYQSGKNSLSSNQAGQGTTTRAFGESSGTLYAGGGGGCGYNKLEWRGSGGSYGGGNGYPDGSAGKDGTGSGGGGGLSEGGTLYCYYGAMFDVYQLSYYNNAGYNGGSGIVIIRWGY